MSTAAAFDDHDEFKAAIDSVRNNATPDRYVIVQHVDGNLNRLRVQSIGQDIANLASEMDDSQVLYALARYERTFDMSNTVKFVYIHWIGEKVPFVKKGRYGVIQGSVQEYFNPYHLLLETSNTEDLDSEQIEKQLDETAGTKSKVLDNEVAQGRQMRGFTASQLPQRNAGYTGGNLVSKTSATIEVSNEVVENIAAVRSNDDPLSWMLACYRDNNAKGPIDTFAQGEGNISEMVSKFEDDLVLYGLYRVVDVIDEIPTVKFVYIQWVGESVKPMMKAKVSTHKGRIDEIMGQSHVKIFATLNSEVSERLIMEKVTSVSGTRSNVK